MTSLWADGYNKGVSNLLPRALVSLLLLVGLGAPGQAVMRCWVLGNGLRVVLKEDHSFPLVAVNLVVRTGPRYEDPAQNGISHYLEHLLFKGTTTRGKGQVQGEIEGMGGVINGGTSRDFTHLYAAVGSRFLATALEVIYDVAAHPSFPEQELELERLVVLEEAQGLRDDPANLLWELAYEQAYRTHPYRMPIAGSAASLQALRSSTLAAYHRERYVPGNMSLVVVGDFDPDRALQLVNRTFGQMAPGPVPEDKVRSEPVAKGERLERRAAVPMEYGLLAFGAPGADTWPEVPAMDLVVTLLSTGYSSRLNQELQARQGILHSAKAQFLTQKDRGLFGLSFTCPAGAVARAQEVLLAQVSRLREEPVPEAELERAKRVLCAEYAFANESFADQADTLGFYEAIGNYNMAASYLDLVRQVTPVQIQAVARRYLDLGNYLTVVLHAR